MYPALIALLRGAPRGPNHHARGIIQDNIFLNGGVFRHTQTSHDRAVHDVSAASDQALKEDAVHYLTGGLLKAPPLRDGQAVL